MVLVKKNYENQRFNDTETQKTLIQNLRKLSFKSIPIYKDCVYQIILCQLYLTKKPIEKRTRRWQDVYY